MAYNRFKKLSQLEDNFQLSYAREVFLLTEQYTEVSERLLLDMADARMIPLNTEKSKSEHIVVPVLKELLRKNADKISYFSGFQFDVDVSKNLAGFCDYILSAKAGQLEVSSPIFCLVEAKNDNIEKGLAQCGAEMYAAQLFNEREGEARKAIYGCVTNAFSWAFLKLQNQILSIDPNYVPLTFDEPNRVVAVLQGVLDKSLENK